MRWWWFGPSQERGELEREMRAMKAGGIGGFEVQQVYPLEVEGNYPYLSNRFLENLRFTAEKASEAASRRAGGRGGNRGRVGAARLGQDAERTG